MTTPHDTVPHAASEAAPDTPGAASPDAAPDTTGATAAPDTADTPGAAREETLQAVDLPDIPPLSFVVPESFHALPIAATEEERAALAREFVRELYPNGDDALWTPAAPYYAALGESMGDQGLAYSALGLFAIDEGVAHCSFTVAAVASDHPSAEVAALGIREILARDETNDVRWLDLPCGPAVSCVTLRRFTIGAELTSTGEEATLTMGQVQVYVPFPTGPFTAVFTMDTAAVDYWGEFSEMTTAVLRSITFPDPSADPAATATTATTAAPAATATTAATGSADPAGSPDPAAR
jgi:hypothetical protein